MSFVKRLAESRRRPSGRRNYARQGGGVDPFLTIDMSEIDDYIKYLKKQNWKDAQRGLTAISRQVAVDVKNNYRWHTPRRKGSYIDNRYGSRNFKTKSIYGAKGNLRRSIDLFKKRAQFGNPFLISFSVGPKMHGYGQAIGKARAGKRVSKDGWYWYLVNYGLAGAEPNKQRYSNRTVSKDFVKRARRDGNRIISRKLTSRAVTFLNKKLQKMLDGGK